MKACCHASLISQVAREGAMLCENVFLRASRSKVLVGPLCPDADSDIQTQAGELVVEVCGLPGGLSTPL